MCLSSNEIFPIKAKEDIVCYKELLLSKDKKYYMTPYIYTRVNRTEKSINGYKLKSGVLGFIIHMISSSILKIFNHPYSIEVSCGFIHTYNFNGLYKLRKGKDRYLHIYKCIIPKGTLYYYDIFGYTSTSIIFKQRVN